MNIENTLLKISKKFSLGSAAEMTAASIAAVKGVCRPMFTMMDKKEKPETKKYTAVREGATELVAIPVYLGCGYVAGKISKFCVPTLQKKMHHHNINIKDAKYKYLFQTAESNLKCVSVLVAAIFIIPALCTLVIKPFMNSILKHKNEDTPIKNTYEQSFTSIPKNINTRPVFKNFSYNPHIGMKVGGL